MSETTGRLLDLLAALQSRPFWSGPELAARLGITVRTVRRDVDRLRGAVEEAEAELIHQAEDPELGRDPELDAFEPEEDAGSTYSEADEVHTAEEPDSDFDG